MKKLLVVVAAVVIGSVAQASELWWTVAEKVSVDGGDAKSWQTAKLFANDTGFNYGGTQVGSDVTFDQIDLIGRAQTELTGSEKYFYIELYNEGTLVGKSYIENGTWPTHTKGAIDAAGAGAIYDGPFSPSASPYSFNNFTMSDVVPEPTSGLLVMLGMMMLGLRRKRV